MMGSSLLVSAPPRRRLSGRDVPPHRRHRRQHGPIRRGPRWALRAACAVAICGVVGVVALRPSPPARTGPATYDATVCSVVDIVMALALEPVPSWGSAEQNDAAQRVNAQLSDRRRTILGLDVVKGLGCD